MKLTQKRRRKSKVLLGEEGACSASRGFDSDTRQSTFVIEMWGHWEQGKGYQDAFELELSKTEMFRVMCQWVTVLDEMARDEKREAERMRNDS